MYVKISKIKTSKLTYSLFGQNYRVATISPLYLTVLEIILRIKYKIGDYSNMLRLKKKNLKIFMFKLGARTLT